MKRAQVVETGAHQEGGENEAIFGIIYTLDDDDDWTQPEALIKPIPITIFRLKRIPQSQAAAGDVHAKPDQQNTHQTFQQMGEL
jgi:phage terminase large subunit-like protein